MHTDNGGCILIRRDILYTSGRNKRTFGERSNELDSQNGGNWLGEKKGLDVRGLIVCSKPIARKTFGGRNVKGALRLCFCKKKALFCRCLAKRPGILHSFVFRCKTDFTFRTFVASMPKKNKIAQAL